MLTFTEMKERVNRANNSAIKLMTSNTVVSVDRHDIETEVIRSIASGKIDFIKITLESGDEEKILQIEKETHQANLKLSMAWLEYQLFNSQKEIINEYIDKISNGEDVTLLKAALHDRLKEASDSIVDQAIKQNDEAVNIIKNKLKMLDIEHTDVYTLRAYYYNYFKQHEIKVPIQSVSETIEKIRSKLSNSTQTKESLIKNYHDLLDKMSELHTSYDKFLEARRACFITILSTDIEKIPLIFNFNPSDKKRIDEFLAIKINPNLVEPLTGDTLLHIAIGHDREDIVHLLLARGADIFIKNNAGISANDKAAVLSNPKYLRIFLLHSYKRLLMGTEYAHLPQEIKDILDPMLIDANLILQEYGIKLSDRKEMSLFLQVIFQYSVRLKSRSQDLAAYTEKLNIALRDGDPNVFFNEVIKRAFIAKRGMFNQSSLHDPLKTLLQKFMQAFDAHIFNELKKNSVVTEPPVRENNSLHEDSVCSLKSKLDSSDNENTILRARLKQYENMDLAGKGNGSSVKQRFF